MNNENMAVKAHLFSRVTLVTCFLFLFSGILSAVLTLLYRSPTTLGIFLVTSLLLLPLCVLAHLQVRRNNLERSVILIVTVWYFLTLFVMIVGSRLYGVMTATAILPVLLTMPFVSQRMLQRIIILSLFFIVIGSITTLFPTLITPTVPDRLIEYVQSALVALLSCIVMFAIWLSGGRLQDAANAMSKAIVDLQESERSLETKVEERTLELEEAFREISDINEIAGIVNSTLDVDKVKNTIYQGLQRVFSFEQMGVFLVHFEDQKLRLELQAGTPFTPELQQFLAHDGLPLDATDSFVAASVVNQETVFLGSVTPERMSSAGASDQHIYQHGPMKSILLCPLLIENSVIGCIYFVAIEKPIVLSDADIQSIERYVTQLGTAIRNAQLFQEVEASRQEAETANETKSTFLASMSHEIRTPMNAIIGLTDLCLETELNPKQRDYLSKVGGAAHTLRTVIDDILDFSKLEAGKIEFENIPFSLNDVLDNLATICMMRCRAKRLELVFQRDPDMPDILLGDPTRLGQILINLAGNAIKFTEAGEIVVKVRQDSRTENHISIHFTVQDSGIGMTEEQQARLFQSFSQADSTISRQYGGTGLGLAISQQLTQLMGSEIHVSSELDIGSSFHFTMEFEITEQETVSAEWDDPPQDLNVLVVDDNEAARDILREYLTSFGYQVTLTTSGVQALQLLQRDHTFDLVLLDWVMPGMTGLEVAQTLREINSSLKVILLSSLEVPRAEHEDIFDAFLTKPVNPSSLLETIMLVYGKRVFHRTRGRIQSKGPEDLKAIQGAKVLVVDDSDINLQIACELLEKIPVVLDTASNGEEAVKKVYNNHYDCVLMDIQMPIMDGYTASSKIREDVRFENLPILAITANVMAEERVRVLDAGMNGLVAKPVDPQELYRAMEESMTLGGYRGNLTTDDANSPSITSAAISNPFPSTLPGLDIEQGLRRLAGNSQLYVKLLGDLLAKYADCHTTIHQLLDSGEHAQARKIAHTVRGIAYNLSAVEIGLGAESIENNLLSESEVTPEQIENLEQALSVAAGSLAQLEKALGPTTSAKENNPRDVGKIFDDLKQAVAASNPNAIELLDQLLAGEDAESDLSQQLAAPRQLLDNFNFVDAEPLLSKIEKTLLS